MPEGVACDASGNVYVADTFNQTIRKITPAGVVTTLAGATGQVGSSDGDATTARFYDPRGLACDSTGDVFVADMYNHTIRKITPDGTVSTYAGQAGNPATVDGPAGAARFNYPADVACDNSGDVYVATQNVIRKIDSTGYVTTVAGSGAPGNNDGIGSASTFNGPMGVACDAAGNVYVADAGNETVRKVTPTGAVTTIAGLAAVAGNTDGLGRAARFYNLVGIADDAVGNLYIADSANNSIRKAVCPATVGGFLRVTQAGGGTISLSGQTTAAPAVVAVQHGGSRPSRSPRRPATTSRPSTSTAPPGRHRLHLQRRDRRSHNHSQLRRRRRRSRRDQSQRQRKLACRFTQTITWTPGNGSDVALELSRDDGAHWEITLRLDHQ